MVCVQVAEGEGGLSWFNNNDRSLPMFKTTRFSAVKFTILNQVMQKKNWEKRTTKTEYTIKKIKQTDNQMLKQST